MNEIENIAQLDAYLVGGAPLERVAFQGVDLRERSAVLMQRDLSGALLLGCTMDDALSAHALACGALVFPTIGERPYQPYRSALYTPEELYDQPRYEDCLDARVYEHWKRTGRANPSSILETLARRLHDHAMTDALDELIDGRQVVAIMGGHGMPRGRGAYADVARIGRALTERGFLMASGGGPGAMEATHVGAWFAGSEEARMIDAIDILAEAAMYDDDAWLDKAFVVREKFPNRSGADSLGIPTWLYGHEPPNPFATRIAKYFANSVREDGLLTIARHGVVFSPGSAGTIQEIFQDACQNHYATVGVSPMIFFGKAYWTDTKPVYPLLEQLARGKDYADWLSITDAPGEVVATLERYASERSAQPE